MNKSTDSKRGFSFNTERSGNREDLSFNPQALAEGTLVSKVALLSCVSAIFMAIGSYFGIGLENSPILVISCIVASFIGLFFCELYTPLLLRSWAWLSGTRFSE